MKKFKDLTFKPHCNGIRSLEKFENGYAISVVRFYASYGYDEGLYEIAVMKDGQICYDTPVTDDVIGYCDEDKITDIMKQIQELENI